jgi:hypothetical protein
MKAMFKFDFSFKNAQNPPYLSFLHKRRGKITMTAWQFWSQTSFFMGSQDVSIGVVLLTIWGILSFF